MDDTDSLLTRHRLNVGDYHRMAEAGVNIEVLYSDHEHQLILVVDDLERGRKVSEAWSVERRE